MSIRSLLERHWKVACVIAGCWTFLALLFTPQTYLGNLRAPAPLTWGQALLASLTLFSVWAALTPLVLWLGNGDQDLVLQNGQQLMLSRNYRDKFFGLLGEL